MQDKSEYARKLLNAAFGKPLIGGGADWISDTWKVNNNDVFIQQDEDDNFILFKRIQVGEDYDSEYEFDNLDSSKSVNKIIEAANKYLKNKQLKGIAMITANNYFDEVKPIVGKLPASVKEAHNLVVAMKKDGIDDPFHTGDSDIDSMGELLLEKANEILSSSSTKTEKPKAESNEQKPKTTKTKIKKVPAPAKEKPKKTNTSRKKVQAAAKKGKRVAQKPTKKMRKAVSRKIKQVVKSVRKADATKPAITKKIYSKELELVKAFIAIKGKEISIASIHTKRNAVYNALKNEKVNQHQAILENILRRYDKVLKAIKDGVTHLKGNIETGFYNTCKNLITNAKIKVRTDVLAGVKKGYRLLSPDGIDIERDTIYKTLDEVETAFNKWKKRYEKQGYYSSNLDQIDLADLADTMTLIDVSTNDWMIYGEGLNGTEIESGLKGIGKGEYSIGEFIAIESEKSKGFTYRGKILFGRPVVLKEKNNSPVKKWAVDDLKTANFISEKLNKYAAKK